jgi:MoaA/NifB/PqqE/SkfB family radical SAM enzyme
VRAASNEGIEIRLYSSGVVGYASGKAQPASRKTWEELVRAGLSKVFFNLQGPDAVSHEIITLIPGSYDAVMQSIRAASEVGLLAGVHFVPMRPNFRRVVETLNVAQRYGAKEFAILRFVAQGRGWDNRDDLELNQDEFNQFLIEAIEIRKTSKEIRVRMGCPFNHRALLGDPEALGSCRAAVDLFHVRPNGDVTPCSAFQQGEIVLGNLRDDSLADITRKSVALKAFRTSRDLGPEPGTVDFIVQFGDACLAQSGVRKRGGYGTKATKEARPLDSRIQG